RLVWTAATGPRRRGGVPGRGGGSGAADRPAQRPVRRGRLHPGGLAGAGGRGGCPGGEPPHPVTGGGGLREQLPAGRRGARRRSRQPTLVGDVTVPIEAVPVSRRATLVGTLGFVAVTAAALTWAKWYPYWHKIPAVAGSHKLGTSILTGTAGAPPSPSWRA